MADAKNRDWVKLAIKTLAFLVLLWGLVISIIMLFFIPRNTGQEPMFLVLTLFLLGGLGVYCIWAGYSTLKNITKRSINHLSVCLALWLWLAFAKAFDNFGIGSGGSSFGLAQVFFFLLSWGVTFAVLLVICKLFNIMLKRIKHSGTLTAENNSPSAV